MNEFLVNRVLFMVLAGVVLIHSAREVTAETKYQVHNNQYKQVVAAPTEYIGQLLSFEGKVVHFKITPGTNLVYLVLKIGEHKELPASPTLFGPMKDYSIEEGETIRVLGIFSPVDLNDKKTLIAT